MGGRLRLLLAVLLAPLAGGMFGSLIAGFLGLLEGYRAQFSPTTLFANQFTHWLPWISIATFAVVIFVGVPMHLLAQRMKTTSSSIYFTMGGTAAATFITLLAILTLGDLASIEEAFFDALQYAAVGVPTGFFTAWIAWLIRRTDRDAESAL